MKKPDLLTLLRNSVTALQTERATAYSSGQVARVLEIDAKILETQTTIDEIESTTPE